MVAAATCLSSEDSRIMKSQSNGRTWHKEREALIQLKDTRRARVNPVSAPVRRIPDLNHAVVPPDNDSSAVTAGGGLEAPPRIKDAY